MTNYSVKTVDEFIEAAAEVARPHLREIQKAIRAAIPEADEKIGYGKPFYKHEGWVTGFDFYKHHIALEIWDGIEEEDKLSLEAKGHKVGSKTFQMPYDKKVPVTLIKKMVKAQVKRNEAKATAKKK